ncbi:hypothetical protein LTS07_002598 [Exophiala sideris]|uniref:COX assembly mitochondrial protein n=1 Tax=Exophiala sideris TaxID=1016849 RepID=A0ABR0JJD0_9EURO|nr:hypothetical protein LTS07_002598 [Exophiala sideris]KAK5066086.1 hypothetical protein LTR69_002604 [Exophiala sideris]KAK5186763.1 hypothetical protein LTR44_000769 [Eurotiomycetes sp. CCFEE 6388]
MSTPQNNLRNPLPLSPAQEGEVRRMYYARVRSKCADEVKQFADCARGRTLSVAWNCRAEHRAMNSCMILYATKAEQDAAREDWFAGVLERRRKKEEEHIAVEKRRVEVIEMTKKQEEKERIETENKLAQQQKEKEVTSPDTLWADTSPIEQPHKASDSHATLPVLLPQHVILLLGGRLSGILFSHHGQLRVCPFTNFLCNKLVLQLFVSKLPILSEFPGQGERSDEPDKAVAEGDKEFEA